MSLALILRLVMPNSGVSSRKPPLLFESFRADLSRCNKSRDRAELLPVERDIGEAFFEVRSVENVTDKEEVTEGYKKPKHDNLEVIAAQKISLKLDQQKEVSM